MYATVRVWVPVGLVTDDDGNAVDPSQIENPSTLTGWTEEEVTFEHYIPTTGWWQQRGNNVALGPAEEQSLAHLLAASIKRFTDVMDDDGETPVVFADQSELLAFLMGMHTKNLERMQDAITENITPGESMRKPLLSTLQAAENKAVVPESRT